jgi:hypothetical protein
VAEGRARYETARLRAVRLHHAADLRAPAAPAAGGEPSTTTRAA